LLARVRRLLALLPNLERFEREREEVGRLLAALRVERDALADLLRLARTDAHQIGLLNIKNLGYELGRILAERQLAPPPAAADPTPLSSKLCVQADFARDWLRYWCAELRIAPIYHRKIWELCYVVQALYCAGQLAPGHRGIGFGCGQEPLPSLFAKFGAAVLATDLDREHPDAQVWRATQQHSSAIESLRRRNICPDEGLLANISFRTVDMKAIPPGLDGQFDFCWSICAFEHLGTLAQGMDFVVNSLRTLKPGGIAVHTTEFTFADGDTIDNYPIVLYQRRHFAELCERLRAAGHEVQEFDFDRGDGVLDRFIDLPPFFGDVRVPSQHTAHLKLLFDGFTCTSIGFIIKAGGASSDAAAAPDAPGSRPARSGAAQS
jgi:SAM-dependent methyltransferase